LTIYISDCELFFKNFFLHFIPLLGIQLDVFFERNVNKCKAVASSLNQFKSKTGKEKMPPLSDLAVTVLKTTAPVVKSEGTRITTRMYEIMFSKYPLVKNLFNATHFVRAGETKTVAPQVCYFQAVPFNYLGTSDK